MCRELAYRDYIMRTLPENAFLGDAVRDKLIYYPSVTRDDFATRGRITDLIASNRLFGDLGIAPFSAERDRLMLCGSAQMLRTRVRCWRDMGSKKAANRRPDTTWSSAPLLHERGIAYTSNFQPTGTTMKIIKRFHRRDIACGRHPADRRARARQRSGWLLDDARDSGLRPDALSARRRV